MKLEIQDIPAERAAGSGGEKEEVKNWLGNFMETDKIKPAIFERLQLLNEKSDFIEDEKHSIQYAQKVFDSRVHENAAVFTDEEKRIVILGLIFSDIGKTGPANADLEQQKLIVRLYNVENVKDPELSVRKIIGTNYPDTAGKDLELFHQMGLEPSMPIKKFWRLHSKWTRQIIENDGIPEEVIPAAVLHHILEGDENYLLETNGEYRGNFGGRNHEFGKEEKIVVLLDKYDAFINRSTNVSHEEAIKRLKTILAKNERFKNDSQFLELINALDKVLKPEESGNKMSPN